MQNMQTYGVPQSSGFGVSPVRAGQSRGSGKGVMQSTDVSNSLNTRPNINQKSIQGGIQNASGQGMNSKSANAIGITNVSAANKGAS